MTQVILKNFTGMRPRIDDHLLPDNASIEANNSFLLSGALTPYSDRQLVKSLLNPGSESIYFYRYGSSPDWLEWDDQGIDVVESPIENEIYDRIYYTGASHFQAYNRATDPDLKPKVYAQFNDAGGQLHPDGNITGDVMLGSPNPVRAPDVNVTQKALALNWTRRWFSFWEDTGAPGARYDFQDLEEGTDIFESEPGKSYFITDATILTKPAPSSLVGDLVFMVGLQAFSNDTVVKNNNTQYMYIYIVCQVKKTATCCS